MELNNINVNEVDNMKTAIKNYKSNLEESISKLSHKVEYAEGFKGSSFAEFIKGYLENMVAELQKVTSCVDELDQSLNNNDDSKKEDVPVEVQLTPVTINDTFES